MTKILAFSGSARKNSFNQQLVNIAADGALEEGADVTVINLGDFSMPIFDEDLEAREGLPDAAKRLKKLVKNHDALLIASPEYNSAFSPLLKNVVDWCSRTETDGEPPLDVFRGKTAAIMATSPGALGGLRGLVFLRMLLENIGVMVIPNQQAVGKAMEAFSEDGKLVNEKKQAAIRKLGKQLTITAAKLK